MNNISNKSSGWNWTAFVLGPFWYLFNGLVSKGFLLLIIVLITLGFAFPVIWIYCGLKGNSDLYEKKLIDKYSSNTKRL